MRFVVFVLALAALAPAHAQTLHDAVEAAWARQPGFRTQAAREAELAARRAATGAFTPEPPSLETGFQSDQATRNRGKREIEVGVSFPLWMPGQRERRRAVVEAETGQLSSGISAAKWRIAGEVREAYWQARLARAELDVVRRKVAEANALGNEVERRFRAADVARIELNQARSVEFAARGAVAEAEGRAFKEQQAFRGLTGLSTLPPAGEPRAKEQPPLDAHPALLGLLRTAQAAQARFEQVQSDRRDPPELSIGGVRERDTIDDPYGTALFLRFKLPFATAARNQPRIAAANVEVIEARSAYELERTRLETQVQAARGALDYATAAVAVAERRFAFAADNQRLASRGFTLGEFDLVTRLRAESERYDAELALARARLEVERAISHLNHAYGLVP